MRAMILAAGRGERMRPLTDSMPKPLLKVNGKPLIQWHVENLVRCGFKDIVINYAYLGSMIENHLGDGSKYDCSIRYSREAEALETAGGIANALNLLDEVFLIVNGDIFCDFDFATLTKKISAMIDNPDSDMAHLVMVSNPEHHPEGDFALNHHQIFLEGNARLTYSGIGIYRTGGFRHIQPGSKGKLSPLLQEWIKKGKVSGQHHTGLWTDVGTPERLKNLNAQLTTNNEVSL
jgi:MurNAc alpha-1-phosphate uridylyltransferase